MSPILLRKPIIAETTPAERRDLEKRCKADPCQSTDVILSANSGRRHWARRRPKTGRASMMASTILLCYDVGKAASIAHFMRWSRPAELEQSRSRGLRERYLIGSQMM